MSITIPVSHLEHIHEAVAYLSADQHVLYVNTRFERIFAMDKAKILGRKLPDMIKLPPDWSWPEVFSLQQGKVFHTRFLNSIFNIEIQITVLPILHVQGDGAFLFYFDDFTPPDNLIQNQLSKNLHLGKKTQELENSKKMEEISFVSSLPEMANTCNSSEEFLNRTHVRLMRSFRFHAIATWVLSPTKELILASFQTDGQIAKTQGVLWLQNFRSHLEEAARLDQVHAFQDEAFSYLLVPHKKRSMMFALTMVALPKQQPADEIQTNILQIFGHQLAVSYENTKLQEGSTMDGLTKLHNAQFFHNRLSSEFIIAETTGSPLSLLLFDIDHFKKLNDTYGHMMGDLVLSEVANVAKQTCRKSDLVCRYGGEEFAVILIDTDERGAHKVAEKIRVAIEKFRPRNIAAELSVTVSVGVATFPQRAKSKDELIKNADTALYLAKRTGRNKVEVYDKSSP